MNQIQKHRHTQTRSLGTTSFGIPPPPFIKSQRFLQGPTLLALCVCRLWASRLSGLSLLSCRLRARRLRASVFAARCAAMDFLELAALCSGRPAAPAPGFYEPPPPPEGAREAGAVVVEPEQDAFMQLALLAARPAEPHKPLQRSHEHTLIARSAIARKEVQAGREQE